MLHCAHSISFDCSGVFVSVIPFSDIPTQRGARETSAICSVTSFHLGYDVWKWIRVDIQNSMLQYNGTKPYW